MQMRTRHPSTLAHPSDDLTSTDRVASRHQGLAEVEVASDDPFAVIEIHDRSRQIKIRHQRHDPGVCRAHRRADLAGEVGAEMSALTLAIQHPRCAEPAGYPSRSRRHERGSPFARGRVRLARNGTRLLDLITDALLGS